MTKEDKILGEIALSRMNEESRSFNEFKKELLEEDKIALDLAKIEATYIKTLLEIIKKENLFNFIDESKITVKFDFLNKDEFVSIIEQFHRDIENLKKENQELEKENNFLKQEIVDIKALIEVVE